MSSTTLRIVSLNVWVLPFELSRDVEARLQRIGDSMAALVPDVAAFQEVWTEAAMEALILSGRRAGLVHVWQNRPGRAGSGLLVLSKLPILESRFEAFESRGRPERVWHGDYHAGKGFGDLTLDTAVGPLRLVVTHLHAGYGTDGYDGTRLAEVIQLTAALRSTTTPLIAVGDFNLEEDEVHHRVLTDLGGLRDAAIERDHRQPTTLANSPYRTAPAIEERIDYIFVRDGRSLGVAARSIDRVFEEIFEIDGRPAAHSDHAGLYADLELDRPTQPPSASARSRETALAASKLLELDLDTTRRRRTTRIGFGVLSLLIALPAFFGGGVHLTRRRFLAALLGAVGVGNLGLAAGPTTRQIGALDRAVERLETLEDAPFL